MEEPSAVRAIGIPRYRAENYDACRRIMADGQKLPVAFHIWRLAAEREEKRLQRLGQTVVRAHIDPETFPDWCRASGLDIDAQGRIAWANRVAFEACRQTH